MMRETAAAYPNGTSRAASSKRDVLAISAMEGAGWMVLGGRLHRFTPAGYDGARACPEGLVTVLTPAPTVAALAAGYRPEIHESAGS